MCMTDYALLIWDWSTDTILQTLQCEPLTWMNLKFLSNCLLAAPYSSSSIWVWNITTGKFVYSLSADTYAIEQLFGNGYLATAGSNNL
jgi:WD40 repeat protein